MPRKAKLPLEPAHIQGLKYLRAFEELLAPLAAVPAHGNRRFHLHHWISLLLLHFFNPVLSSLRALQQATGLSNVQRTLGVGRSSLGAMSESAGKVFDPELLRPVLDQAAAQVQALPHDPRLDALPGLPMATDGSFLRCLPKMAWALFRRQTQNRAAKLHVQFDVLRGIPGQIDLTHATASEKQTLRKSLRAALLYILDRGYIDYSLFQAIHDGGSFFVARLKDNSAYTVLSARPLRDTDRAAGVLTDQLVRIGSAFTAGDLTAPVRRITIQLQSRAGGGELILLTNTDLEAETVALLYRHRWQVELFFRWFKCILGCTHWLSTTYQGVTLQVYVAVLASLLISLWTGRKPTKRTFEMICLYFQGWARADELSAHIAKLKTVA